MSHAYTYDAENNRTSEKISQGVFTWQNQTMQYNALGWLYDIRAHGKEEISIQVDFDANGNRQRMTSNFSNALEESKTIQMQYGFDAMNRQVSVQGGTHYVAIPDPDNGPKLPTPDEPSDVKEEWDEATNEQVSYDFLGNRINYQKKSTDTSGRSYAQDFNETYEYDAAGRLRLVQRGEQITVERFYDSAGRTVKAKEDGQVRVSYYDKAGRLRQMHSDDGAGMNQSDMVYDEYDAIGNLRRYRAIGSKDQSKTYTITYNDADRFDGYNESSTTVHSSEDGDQDNTTRKFYDANGFLVKVTDQAKPGNERHMVNDASGRILSVNYVNRPPVNGISKSNSYHLQVNGQLLASYGARHESLSAGFESITSSSLSAAPGTYTVQSAQENLRSIANALWGDRSLWYMIADANGLQYDTDLRAGQHLAIPHRINVVRNNYDTYQTYNASQIIGDTTPGIVAGSGPNLLCGRDFANFLSSVVAFAVTMFTGISALGNAAGQIIQIANGSQHGFNWKSVAMAGLQQGISAGVDFLVQGTSLAGTDLLHTATRSVLANVTTQAIGVQLNLQDKFDWRSVAVAGAAPFIQSGVSKLLDNQQIFGSIFSDKTSFAYRATSSFVTGLASAVLGGGRTTVAQVALDAFGNSIGASLGDALKPKADNRA